MMTHTIKKKKPSRVIDSARLLIIRRAELRHLDYISLISISSADAIFEISNSLKKWVLGNPLI